MKKENILLGLLLFFLGCLGVLSLLTADFPIPEDAAKILEEQFTPFQIKLLLLINPAILLFIFTLIGTLLYKSAKLEVPILEGIITKEKNYNFSDILKFGIIGGIVSGILLSLIGLISMSFLPQEFIELGENLKPSLAVRFLYGGITEEILMRFGLMTLIVWIAAYIFKNGSRPYWIGIILAAIIFGLGHFPIAFQAIESPSIPLLLYILIGNSIGGIIFGWLYWKKGLESAMIAHIFAHIIMVLGESIFG